MQCGGGGPYWFYDLGDKSKYLGEELFNVLITEGTTGDDADFESSHWCIIKARTVGKQGD